MQFKADACSGTSRKPSNFEVDMVSREDQLLSFAPCSIHQENIEVCHRTNDDIALLCVPS